MKEKHYDNHTRQHAYDTVQHHIGKAQYSTISMGDDDDWQLYQLHRRSAYMHLTEAIEATRTLWQNDHVLMGAWFGLRADWYLEALEDLRRITAYVNMEQDLLHDNKRGEIAEQRRGMRKAWNRVRATMSRVSSTHAKNA